jgi:glycosyltransferase involved in cell wall biosynthesis
MPDSSRFRVLVVADSCNPEWESIPLEGWSHYHALSELVDTHLVTRNWNIPALDRQGLVEGRDFTALNTDALFNPMQALVQKISGPNKGFAMLTALSMPSYLMFEHLFWRRFKNALRAGQFDLVHRITPLSPAVPSPIAGRCRRLGVPFVIGPLNGGLPWPKQFPELQRAEGEFLSRFREAYRLVPGYRATREAASAIIVGGACAMTDLPQRWHAKAVYVPENGIEPSRFPRLPPRTPDSYRGRPLRAVFLGRLVPYKGADMLLQAAAPLLQAGRMTIEVIGFGPEQERLERMVADDGLGAAVSFAGKVPHHELAARLQRADVMTFPSVHEFGGAVILEGMAMGLVPVVVNYGGPGELVSPASGFLLPLGDRDSIVAALRATLEAIIADPAQLAAKSRCAVERAFGLFAWPAKARQTYEVYRWVLGHRADRPVLDLPLADPVAIAAE